MHRIIALLILVTFCSACSVTERQTRIDRPVLPDPAKAPELRVSAMTYNIRFGTADDGPDHWRHRGRHCIDIIRRHGGDFVSLQEALRFQIEEIRVALPHYGEIGVGRSGWNRNEHTTILFDTRRWELDRGNYGTFWLSDTPWQIGSRTWGNTVPRTVTWGRFIDRRNNLAVWVFNTHFDHASERAREKSAVMLARRAAERSAPQEPVIIMGDLNAREDSNVMAFFTARGELEGKRSPITLVDTFRVVHPNEREVGTFNGFRYGNTRGRKIDYILVERTARVHRAAIVRDHYEGVDKEQRYPSDHFPVTAEISWR